MGEIDLYCERTGPGLLAEPVNAVTNLAFFLAALLALSARRRIGVPGPGDWVLIGLTLTIGSGSLAFHTLANRASMLADVVPILLFQIAFLAQHSRRVLRFGWQGILAVFALFAALIAAFSMLPRELMNGSLGYAPALLMMMLLATLQQRQRDPGTPWLAAATGLFVVSLTLRSIDMAVCPGWPLGTHAFWHLANGGVLYMCMRSLWAAQAEGAGKKKPGQAPA